MIYRDPDHTLVTALRACVPGDCPELFARLHDRHRERIHALCRRLTRNEEDALDAVQETFATASSQLERFRGEALFSTWLHRIAFNKCGEIRRRRRRRLRLEEPMPGLREGEQFLALAVDDGPLPADLASESERDTHVRAAVEALPDWLRRPVELRYYEHLPYEDIAVRLGLPIGTIKSRLYRAHRTLAATLGTLELCA
jgi:RNA polymerase sigma-70 factor (ECF subfamily)